MNGPENKPIQLRRAESVAAADAPIVDCWNRVGVHGDRSCVELERHGHCHNCPVYAHAGSQFLNRPLLPAYREEWTGYFAEKRAPAAGSRMSVVVFRVGAEWLALPAYSLQEIAEQRPIHSIPHRTRGVVLGLVNIRGELLVCVSVARLLGLDPTGAPEGVFVYGTRLLVFAWGAERLTFPADDVHGIHRLHPEEVTRPAARASRPGAAPSLTRGVFSRGQKIVGLLDPETLFSTLNRSLA